MLKNLSKHISVVILLCMGFFLVPSISYGCAKKLAKTEQNSNSKDQFYKAEIKDCCKTKSCKRDKDHNDCSGKCKHSSCKCSTSSSSLSLPTLVNIKTENHFAEIKTQKFGFKQAYYSSGYYSFWQPPKIS